MAALRILLVDDDAWTGHLVSSVLHKRGHEVSVARSVEAALHILPDVAPDVLITEALLASGEEAGRLLVQRYPRFRDAASLVLSTLAQSDERVRAVSADGYLGKPFRFIDLDRAVERALQVCKRRVAPLAASEQVAAGPSAGIHGTLDQLSLGSLLTMIEMERKSGILLLRRGSQSARLYCKDGRVMAARLFGASPSIGQVTGAEVVYRLLRWTDGHFNFTAMPVSVTDEIGLRTTHLLLEGARRSDEALAPGT
jgi:DNA-binding response OmpR family regulator